MKGIASNTSSLQKTHSTKGVVVKLQALQERVMIDRSFVNCPTLRHSSPFLVASFSMTYKRQSNCPVSDARFQTRPDVKNPARSERRSCSEDQRSLGWREPRRIEKANRLRRWGAAHNFGFARSNPSGSRGCWISKGMRFRWHHAPKLPAVHLRVDCTTKRRKVVHW